MIGAAEVLSELQRRRVSIAADGDTLCLKPRHALGCGGRFYGRRVNCEQVPILPAWAGASAEVAKDDSPGPKCSVKVTPKKDGQYKFVIKNAGGANTVTFKVMVAK